MLCRGKSKALLSALTNMLQGLIAVMLFRLSPHLDRLGKLWLAAEMALCMASISCELTLRWHPHSRLARVREVLTALWIALVCGGGRVGPLLRAIVDSWDSQLGLGADNAAVAAVVVVFASDVAVQMMVWAKPLRLM